MNTETGTTLVIITVVLCFTIIVSIFRLTAYAESVLSMKYKSYEEETTIEDVQK